MAMDITIFETLTPSRFISFTISHPTLSAVLLRVAVLDSPSTVTATSQVAAIFVPENRESDWIFSTESGHFQLLLSAPAVSRLILIGKNPPNPSLGSYIKVNDNQIHFLKHVEDRLKPLFIALSPNSCRMYDVPVMDYVDNLISSVVLEQCVGSFVGEMLVEDVEIASEVESGVSCRKREFRRRLRFKRMPNLIQTEIRILPRIECVSDDLSVIGEVEFETCIGDLVHPYLIPMVAGLSLLGFRVEEKIRKGVKCRALCLGVGGGALLSFLKAQFDFEVFGVEMDAEVLRVARQYFALDNSGYKIVVGDAIEILERLAGQSRSPDKVELDLFRDSTEFDVIMVDLDCCDARSGISAPPLEFIERHILSAASSILCDFGILVLNVIPPTRSFYHALINVFREFFNELYEIDVGNGENFVLVAKKVPVSSAIGNTQNNFLKKLKNAISGKYLDSIKKI
ncbi:S-adenosyl-L-methionine-dependent methyltransferases superfamily protein [Euphorbia peplus]|nr:S-adenosyl-L-methionine-dependent methyltransferases superfamily protein [Euphorbia peplus]